MPLLRFLPWFRRAAQAMLVLEAREAWPRTDLEAHQLERLNLLWAEARLWVPYYRDLASRLNLPVRWATLDEFRSRLPVLTRTQLQSQPALFISQRRGPGHMSRTGGSTGEPLNIFWSDAAHQENMYSRYRFLQQWGIDPLDPTVYLWGHGASFLPGWAGWWARLRQPWLDWLRGRLRLSAYRLAPEDLGEHLLRMLRYRPTVLYAYTTAAALLARKALEMQASIPTLRLAILTAEPVYPHLVREVERGFGVPAVCEYGSIDCGLIANESPDRTLRVREDRILLETLPRSDGRHDIVISILGNLDAPLLRYAVGDTTDRPLSLPERGFAILHNVAGRANDLLLTRTGRIVHSTALDSIVELLGGEDLYRYLCHQEADGSLRVVIEVRSQQDSVPTARIQSRMEQLLEGFPVEVKLTTALPCTPAGKHRWIRSDRYQQQVAKVAERIA